jgi:hypothetical protein
MTEIGNQYTDAKQKYFLKLLDECSIDQFKALSTESGRLTMAFVKLRQSYNLNLRVIQNSIRRMTKSAEGNKLDGRFRKGLLSVIR